MIEIPAGARTVFYGPEAEEARDRGRRSPLRVERLPDTDTED